MKGRSSRCVCQTLYQLLNRPAVLQRVASASVTVDSVLVSSIGKGVLVFAAVAKDDTRKEVESMAAKVLKLKMWPDDTGGTVRVQYICQVRIMLTRSDIVEAKCTGHQRRSSLWYVENGFLIIDTVWSSELKTFSIPVHLACINQEREQAGLSWRCRWPGSQRTV